MRYFLLILSGFALILFGFTLSVDYLILSCTLTLLAIFCVLDDIYDKLKEK